MSYPLLMRRWRACLRAGIVAALCAGLASAGCFLFGGRDWVSGVERSHRLVGRIWDVRADRRIGEGELVERLVRHRFAIFGEKHDNADHHLLQARLLDALGRDERTPAVAFEMLSADVAGELLRVQGRPVVGLADVRAAVDWDGSSWPEWRLYAPIFEVALRRRLKLVAADAPRGEIDAISRDGVGALARREARRLGIDAPLPSHLREGLADEIIESHCGYMDDSRLDPMIDVQRFRDASMAFALVAGPRRYPDGAVLIAGTGHARLDRGVPLYFARHASLEELVVVAFLEVRRGFERVREDLADRYGGAAPFDYVWYTPRVDELDPCEKYREQLERMRHRSR